MAAIAWQEGKPIQRKHKEPVAVQTITIQDEEASSAQQPADPAVPEDEEPQQPAVPGDEEPQSGCCRCRWSRTGCLTCNPEKKVRYLAKQLAKKEAEQLAKKEA